MPEQEIVAGLAKPLDLEGMQALIHQHDDGYRAAFEKAEELVNRIANGRRTIAAAERGELQGLSAAAIPDAKQRLAGLEAELREQYFHLTAGLGLQLAAGVALLTSEAAQEWGWSPPPNSVIRLVMPGIVNVAVKLEKRAQEGP